jgi:hypothetical protein
MGFSELRLDSVSHYKSFDNASHFKYFGITLTNKNFIKKEIKRRNSGNACHHSVQNLQSSHLLSKNIETRMYKTVVLPLVLYGCETWSLTSREEHRLGMFENRVLKRIFGQRMNEGIGGRRRLHEEEPHYLYSSSSIVRIIKLRRMRWAELVARMVEKRNTYRLLVGKPEGRRHLRRPRHRWVDNVRMIFEMWDGVMWTGLVWLRIGTGGEFLQ